MKIIYVGMADMEIIMKKTSRRIAASNIILAFSIIVLALSIFFASRRELPSDKVLIPDRAPSPDAYAEKISDMEVRGREEIEFANSVTVNYSGIAEIDIEGGVVKLEISNTEVSENDFTVRLMIHGTLIAQSGLLEAGYKLTTLEILDNLTISPGYYDGVIELCLYDGDGMLLPVESKIELTVNAK